MDLKIFTKRFLLQSFKNVSDVTRGGRVNSIFSVCLALPLKLNELPPVMTDFHENFQGGSMVNIFKSMESMDFLYLLSK